MLDLSKGDADKELPDEDEVIGNRLVHEGKNVVKDCEFKVETVNGDVQRYCWWRMTIRHDMLLLYFEIANTKACFFFLLIFIQAANGLQAWKILENRTNQIDLVLSEVVMPCLSGIRLLCKIMSHKTHNNIPVIMMSSHDSVGLVFKCLSKGAADFLVKPIRKNELKNLWQHVWRRCQSWKWEGSGTQTQKSVKSKTGEQSGNNSGSYNGEDNQGSAPLGNGSDTQSSWTKQAVEVDSSQAVSPCNQAPERGDSICAQVIR
ncbi:hypothetical protein K7X08_014863 [Anisodus acutangulus]|uniref:Response regulatory domain-containing protein n=1 Tax=Anisodus acutangulus TaxID=402998 RepID=A0A9Q1LJB5_9SOLA|nr:hypothetical protein K7X08_014863 [Anisodus acutangulus]